MVGFVGFGGYYQCDCCGDPGHERVFTDTFTGLELCLMCVSEVAARVTMSPDEDGDNLLDELRKSGRLTEDNDPLTPRQRQVKLTLAQLPKQRPQL